MKALNEALSIPPKTRDERDARMAAALALAFQSSHLQDGLLEFLTMLRGCNLIAMEGMLGNVDSVFQVSLFFPAWEDMTRAFELTVVGFR